MCALCVLICALDVLTHTVHTTPICTYNLQVNVLMVGVLDKLPEGDSGTVVRSVYLETFAAEWTARLSTLSTDLIKLAKE
jgi:hypothetical protein